MKEKEAYLCSILKVLVARMPKTLNILEGKKKGNSEEKNKIKLVKPTSFGWLSVLTGMKMAFGLRFLGSNHPLLSSKFYLLVPIIRNMMK